MDQLIAPLFSPTHFWYEVDIGDTHSNGGIVEVGRTTRESWRRQQVISSHNRKVRRHRENVASCGGPEPREGQNRGGGGGAKKRKKSQTICTGEA